MLRLLTWGLVVHGVTQIVTLSRIFRPLRERLEEASNNTVNRAWGPAVRMAAELSNCPMCFGFWVGLGLGLAGWDPCAGLAPWPLVLRVVADGAASSAIVWGAHVVLTRLGALEL